MAEKGGIFDALRAGVHTEEELAVQALFPTTDKFKMLQMITEQMPRSVIPWSVLGVFRRKYKSDVLKMFQEEHNLNKIAQDRKGRGELAEIMIGVRRKEEKEED